MSNRNLNSNNSIRSNDGAAAFLHTVKQVQIARRLSRGRSTRRSMSHGPQNVSNRSIASETTPLRTVSFEKATTKPEEDPSEFDDEVEQEEPITTREALMAIFFGKGIVSACMLAAPLAVWSHYAGWNDTYIFWLNFITIIPLAAILGDFTEELALHTNETIGGLINASFGNAVEVVVAINALLAGEIRVVQGSLLGSICKFFSGETTSYCCTVFLHAFL